MKHWRGSESEEHITHETRILVRTISFGITIEAAIVFYNDEELFVSSLQYSIVIFRDF